MSTKQGAAMFAPKFAEPQTKTAETPISKLTPQRSVLVGHRPGHDSLGQALLLQRTIGNQATLRLLAQQRSRLVEGVPDNDHEQEAAPEKMMARAAPRGASWDFTKIPIFAPDRANRPQARSSLSPPPSVIQPKLAIGDVNDPLEHEADRVADQVMRIPNPGPSITGAPPQISRKCAACEEEAKTLQAKRVGVPEAAAGEAPAIVYEVLRAPGRPLDAATRAFFEPRFGFDFGQVRSHTDEHAVRSARAIGASAYTVGQAVVVGQGAFAPTNQAGRRLLAHELTHVIQQAGNSATSAHLQRQDEASEPSKAEEAAGARLGALAARPSQAIGQWQGLQNPERSFIVMTMAGRYGADFAQEFLNYAEGRKKPDLSTEVTNTETAQSLTARGFRFAGDPGGVQLWVHPSGHEAQLLSRGEKPPAPPEETPKDRAFRLCSDMLMMAGPDGCNACCDKNITGTSDYDTETKEACKEMCGG